MPKRGTLHPRQISAPWAGALKARNRFAPSSWRRLKSSSRIAAASPMARTGSSNLDPSFRSATDVGAIDLAFSSDHTRAFSDRLESLRDPVGLKMLYSCSVGANRQAGCEHTRSDFALGFSRRPADRESASGSQALHPANRDHKPPLRGGAPRSRARPPTRRWCAKFMPWMSKGLCRTGPPSCRLRTTHRSNPAVAGLGPAAQSQQRWRGSRLSLIKSQLPGCPIVRPRWPGRSSWNE